MVNGDTVRCCDNTTQPTNDNSPKTCKDIRQLIAEEINKMLENTNLAEAEVHRLNIKVLIDVYNNRIFEEIEPEH
jgi:hypothetical protein